MAILRIPGLYDNYLFDPDNLKTALRLNGKFGNVYAGVRESDSSKVIIKHLNPALLCILIGAAFRFEAEMDYRIPF